MKNTDGPVTLAPIPKDFVPQREDFSQFEIICDEQFITKLGSNSLIGYLVTQFKSIPKKLILKFPTSSLAYCQKNKGPFQYIVSDFNIPCFLEDVLYLISEGVKISVTTFEDK